jgi:hypothetical protein
VTSERNFSRAGGPVPLMVSHKPCVYDALQGQGPSSLTHGAKRVENGVSPLEKSAMRSFAIGGISKVTRSSCRLRHFGFMPSLRANWYEAGRLARVRVS